MWIMYVHSRISVDVNIFTRLYMLETFYFTVQLIFHAWIEIKISYSSL